MYLFYIDESGNTGADLTTAQEPVHWLVAVGVSMRAVHAIEADMLGIAMKYFRSRGSEADFEFHGSDLFGARGDARNITPSERVAVYQEVLGLLQRHSCKIWVRGIDKPLHARRARERGYSPEHPYKLGFMYLVESIDYWLQTQQPDPSLFQGASDPVYGLLVCDQQDEVSRDLVGRFAHWRQSGTSHGYKTRDVKYLIDTVHSVPSHDSWLLQLVDCAAFIRNRCEKIGRKHGWDPKLYMVSDRAVFELWEKLCRSCIVDERVWPLQF